jgi:hypothetical protein
MGSPRYLRNQRLKCICGGYHFPHRRAGGACDHSKTRDIHLAKRGGDKNEVANAIASHAWNNSVPSLVCPF